jgi:serine/threonine protein kinase
MGSDSAPSSQASGSDQSPRRVVRMGKYEVVQHIATGGMGAVYRGVDTENDREVALKVLSPENAAKRAMLVRFQREARSALKLRHENIVTTYEIGEVGGAWFLAMEFIDGIDLHDYVKRHGPLDPEEARQIILQGARALRHAGELSIVHRDIKPSNFLLTRKNNKPLVKLTDFGLAREIDADEFRVTRAGTTVGTIDYMSPEQARDSSAADLRSDLYSLGSTWYHLLTGHAPFPDGGLGERLIKIMNDPPPDLREENPRVSDETWGILSRLLEKDPDDRFQSPAALIEELLALEGKAATRSKANTKLTAKKKSKKKDGSKSDTDAQTRAPTRTGAPQAKQRSRAASGKMRKWYILAGLACLLAVGVVVAVSLSKKPHDNATVERSNPEGLGSTSADKDNKVPDDKGKPPDDPEKKLNDKDRSKEGVKPPVEPVRVRWPALTPRAAMADVKALREEVNAPFAKPVPIPADAFRARVARVGGSGAELSTAGSVPTFLSLAEACAAAPSGRAIVIDVEDNGPLFELPLAISGRDLTIRAARGFRPLILWDLSATLAERKRAKKTDQPLTFLQVEKGSLSLEGLEMVWRWPEALAEPGVLLDVDSGNLTLQSCTISAAGKPPQGVTLARLHGGKDKARCRFTRCYARGAGLTALDLEHAAAVLFDGCLVAGGSRPLLRLRASSQKGLSVSVVRSTLVGAQTMLELKPAAGASEPALAWLSWDSLISRGGASEGGEMVSLLDGASTRGIDWRSINCLYAGWKSLLAGSRSAAGDNLREWQALWGASNSDGVARDPWPDQTFTEPATQPAATYAPARAVGYASTVNPELPLGCDLKALPETRDAWPVLALEPVVAVPDPPTDGAPEIPMPNDGRYHGERLEVRADVDLGAYLARMQARYKLGPRVVMHLSGKGERISSPISLKGTSLVLYFEEPTDKDAPPLVVKLGSTTSPVPLIDVVDGNVEVIGGTLRAPDSVVAKVSHLIRVKGGEIKLQHARLEGPQQSIPDGYRAAVALVGSGDPAPEKMRGCAISECVILSSRAGVLLDGVGCRLLLRQSVVVSGTEALHLGPGASCKGRVGMHCILENVTFAGKTAVVRLGDAPSAGVPTEPAVVQTRDCAYLNPFPGKPSKAGLLLSDGDALSHGLLLWQGENEGFDQRLYFAAARRGALPDKKEGWPAWKRLWGSLGTKNPRPELTSLREFAPRNWALERLILPIREPPGANLKALGIGAPRKGAGTR